MIKWLKKWHWMHDYKIVKMLGLIYLRCNKCSKEKISIKYTYFFKL